MKKTSITFAILFTAAAFALVSCKKDYSNIVKLSAADTGKVITVQKGKVIMITLSDPGVGGYDFNSWQYSDTVLHLENHQYNSPPDAKAVGSAGTDTWWFTAVTPGTTVLKITASQGPHGIRFLNMFNGTIKVE